MIIIIKLKWNEQRRQTTLEQIHTLINPRTEQQRDGEMQCQGRSFHPNPHLREMINAKCSKKFEGNFPLCHKNAISN